MNTSNNFFTILIISFYFILTIVGTTIDRDMIIDKIDNIKLSNNSIIKSNYNVKLNTFNIVYVKQCDTLALDDLYPYELDSLIHTLNK